MSIYDEDDKDPNEGFNKRVSLLENSATVDMMGRLHVDLFNQDRLLLNLVDLKIKLILEDNVFSGQMPKRLVLACVDNDAFNENYKKYPFEFNHYYMNFLGVYVDGQPMPHQPLELDFEKDNYIRAYQNLFLQSESLYLSRTEFPKGDLLDNGVEGNTSTARKRLLEVGLKATRLRKKAISNSENDEKTFSKGQKIPIMDC
ncbi:uncharacterized protein F54H12.2 [Trichonephila clavipes]|nr:uncharacterized protein F54H12.2 [Trichonephila clavipes]